MIAALIAVSGPLDIFAGTTDASDDQPTTVENVITENQSEVEGNESNNIDSTENPADNGAPAGTETPAATPVEGGVDTLGAPARAAAATEITEINVTADEVTPYSVKLSWTFNEGAELGEQTVTVLNGEDVVASDVSGMSYTVTDLMPATSYTFAVKVGDVTGKAENITTASVDLGFRSLSSYNAVKLVWNNIGAARYEVTCAGTWGDGTLYNAGGTECWHTGFPTYDVTNTASGPIVPTDYTYKITAYDASDRVIAESTTTGYPVRTMYYKLTFKKKVKLTSHSGGKYKTTFYKGQVVYARGFDGGKYHFDYLCADGTVRTYYAMKIRAKAAIWTDHINPDRTPYTAEEATMYVNARGITANKGKKYMVWVNTYTQREYVFYGSTGNWTCVQGPWLVSTGKASKPTATGSTNISSRKKKKHGIPTWSMCRYFSLHGKQKSWVLGWPRSGACVRNYNENASWIYYTVPMKSRVFVF